MNNSNARTDLPPSRTQEASAGVLKIAKFACPANTSQPVRSALAGLAGLCLAAGVCANASAATWSDTFLGLKYGSKFAEPFNPNDIAKTVATFGHASGYKYGSNFFNIDYLMSDKNDPAFAGATHGAREIYAIYRHTVDFGAVSGQAFKVGPIKGLGFTVGFDVNTKNDVGYNSKKQMLVAGPAFFIDVPAGFLTISLLQLWESNAPFDTRSGRGVARYHYDPHPMLSAAWGIPVSAFFFKGVANFITEKGRNEFGGATKAETFIDLSLMYDLAPVFGTPKSSLQAGVGYNYWKNKFGNDAGGPAGSGAFARTPNVKVEYHF